MDRSHRTTHARRCASMLIALIAAIGCNGRSSAPVPVIKQVAEPLVRRLSAADPTPQPQAFPALIDQHVDTAAKTTEADAASVEDHSHAVQVTALGSEAPTDDAAERKFSISKEDAARHDAASSADEPGTDEAPQPEKPKEKTEPTTPAAHDEADDSRDDDSLLPWGSSTPTPEMKAIDQRAEETARRGFDLAERGALYTARAQFIEVLRTVAQAVDAQRNTTAHTRALAAGLRAMEEVDDFVPRGTQLETDLNLKLIVDAHRTPVLKDKSLDSVTTLEAQRLYLTYAQEQLSAAAGDQDVASLALYGLGKVCAAPPAMHGPREQIAEAKAVVFYQSALVVEPRNSVAANELGVLLARFGRLEEARTVLERSVALSNAPTAWKNLAVVYDRLGDAPHAEQARRQADAVVAQLRQAGYSTAGLRYPIDWLDPESFARTNSMVIGAPSAAAPQQSSVVVPQTAAKPDKKTSSWLWWK